VHVFTHFLYAYARDRLSVSREFSTSEHLWGHGRISATERAVDTTNASPRATPRARAQGEEAAQEIVRGGGRAIFHRVDVAREHDTHSVVDETVAAFGGLDILVNNAGIMPGGSVLTPTVEEWDQVMAINLKGMFLCARAAVPAMRARGAGHVGSIINMASPTGLLGYPDIGEVVRGLVQNQKVLV
jgi:NAD(P)-dependent dehydrogenase (short-subunit alcohol dehydrogenase family)